MDNVQFGISFESSKIRFGCMNQNAIDVNGLRTEFVFVIMSSVLLYLNPII